MGEYSIDFIARICHEVNRTWCELTGDYSQKPWDDAEDWQKQSTRDGVRYALEHPEATPEDQHVAWMQERAADGWKYGEVKDAEAKTHPCMVPYSDLPFEQRVKDHLFRAVVLAAKVHNTR